MSSTVQSSAVHAYFSRFGFHHPSIAAPPAAELGTVVVIPCHDEPDLLSTLRSLGACTRPKAGVEVIVVVNGAESAPSEVRRRNAETFRTASEWADSNGKPWLRFHLLDFPELPEQHAGVGLARKIGMDEALARLAAVGNLGRIRQETPAPSTSSTARTRRCNPVFAQALCSTSCSSVPSTWGSNSRAIPSRTIRWAPRWPCGRRRTCGREG
jgi:hypothetical protein